MNTNTVLRGTSLAAQQWITEQQRGGWKCPDCGWVVCYLGKPFGWQRELGDPSKVVPGTVAVPVTTTGGFWVAEGGNADAGAETWRRLQ